jgi:hypothetical protein
MKKILSCLLIFMFTASPVWASPDPGQKHIESVRKKVAACVNHHRRVVVETYDNRRLLGIVSEAGTDDFVLNYADRATTLSYREVRKIRWPSPVWKQVELVAGAAAIVGALYGLVVLFGGLRG